MLTKCTKPSMEKSETNSPNVIFHIILKMLQIKSLNVMANQNGLSPDLLPYSPHTACNYRFVSHNSRSFHFLSLSKHCPDLLLYSLPLPFLCQPMP